MNAILVYLFAFFVCLMPVKQPENIEEIRFSSSTRGYSMLIILTPDSFTIREQGGRTGDQEITKKASKAEWEQLVQAVSDLTLTGLDKLEPPTNKRGTDRALHSRLTIRTSSGEYESEEFDGYNPHKNLVPLVEQIRKIKEDILPAKSH